MSDRRSLDLDSLCDEYETRQDAEFGPAAVRSFLALHAEIEFDQQFELCLQLACADLELVWMRWSKHLESQIDSTDLGMLLERFQSLPSLIDYASILESLSPDASLLRNAMQTLAETEHQTRSRYGDAIGEPFFFYHHAITVANVECPVYVKIRHNESTLEQFSIRGCTIFGRCKRPSDPSMVQREWGNRIVLSDWFESTISRTQLAVQLLSPKYAVVTNLSQLNPIDVSSKGELAFGQPILIKLPFTVRCGWTNGDWTKRLVFESIRL